MYLKTLIEILERNKNNPVRLGFTAPHSYRGYYEDLAFEPCKDSTAQEMLNYAKEALGKTYEGYKGGEFKMHEFTECWLANYGRCGESINRYVLAYIFNKDIEDL